MAQVKADIEQMEDTAEQCGVPMSPEVEGSLRALEETFVREKKDVHRLLAERPAATKARDRYGRLPLHIAAEERAEPEVVRWLLEVYPSGARQADKYGELPLHAAVRERAEPGVVRLLLEAYPNGARSRGRLGLLPIHVAVDDFNSDSDVVRLLVEAHPNGPKERDEVGSGGELALHIAAREGATDDVVAVLLQAHAAGAREKGRFSRLPLHIAAEAAAEAAVVRRLGDVHPVGAREKDNFGRLPLHLALRGDRSPDLEVVKIILDKHRLGARETDRYGQLPLHAAVQRAEDAAVVRLLLAVHPDGVRQADHAGLLPLHLAAGRVIADGSSEVVEALLRAYPEAALKQDPMGRLPVHIAVAPSPAAGCHGAGGGGASCNMQAAGALARAWPESVSSPDPTTGRAPMEAAAALRSAWMTEGGLPWCLTRLALALESESAREERLRQEQLFAEVTEEETRRLKRQAAEEAEWRRQEAERQAEEEYARIIADREAAFRKLPASGAPTKLGGPPGRGSDFRQDHGTAAAPKGRGKDKGGSGGWGGSGEGSGGTAAPNRWSTPAMDEDDENWWRGQHQTATRFNKYSANDDRYSGEASSAEGKDAGADPTLSEGRSTSALAMWLRSHRLPEELVGRLQALGVGGPIQLRALGEEKVQALADGLPKPTKVRFVDAVRALAAGAAERG